MFTAIESFLVSLRVLTQATEWSHRETQRSVIDQEMEKLQAAISSEIEDDFRAYKVNQCIRHLTKKIQELFDAKHVLQRYEIALIKQYVINLQTAIVDYKEAQNVRGNR